MMEGFANLDTCRFHIRVVDERRFIAIDAPMPSSFAFSSAAAAAILAASRESVGRLFVADMSMDVKKW